MFDWKVAIAIGTLESFGRQELLSLKTAGFSDRQIARYAGASDDEVGGSAALLVSLALCRDLRSCPGCGGVLLSSRGKLSSGFFSPSCFLSS